MLYDEYNREERYLCSHLFRLIHEPTQNHLALREFLGGNTDIEGFRVFAEVALLRDAYHQRRNAPSDFLDKLTRLLMAQEGVVQCRLYSELPEELRWPHKTHPKQIRHKGRETFLGNEARVYGAMQGMFNAKPDLAICVANKLIIYEAKFTLGFDAQQMRRTRNIGLVWAELLFDDLGFSCKPTVEVRTLGMEQFSPDISWEAVLRIAELVYPHDDRTRNALGNSLGHSH